MIRTKRLQDGAPTDGPRKADYYANPAWAVGLLQKPQARVLCQDSRRGYLSADMDLEDVTQTPAGWVLYFPRRADSERRVEAWEACEVHQ